MAAAALSGGVFGRNGKTNADEQLIIPSFTSEAEEAAWWYKHREAVEADIRDAIRDRKTIWLQTLMAQAKDKKKSCS